MLEVAEFLGHEELRNTRLCIQVEKSLFKNLPNDMFITRIAHTAEQACSFIEIGFEYVTTLAERSSENENKVYAMNLTRPCKSDQNHGKAWKCGRGEVAW